ncbi:hypothetical protein FRC03_007465 [Tulasnella sp. 419]|nr:hypothetical protein FRC03_007465 [Tulasnella sp. 419]
MSTSLISKSNLNPTYVAAISVVLASGMIYRYTWPKKKSQLADLPTPPNPHWFWGHLPKVIDTTNNQRIAEEWAETYGDNIAVDGLIFTQKKLWTLDPKTIGYVLSKASLYPKPEDSIIALEQITGNGLLVVEGDAHKRQRKVLNPAFSPARIREFVPIFFEKSKLMVTRWTEIISENGGQESTVDVLNWMGRATLDVIGEAGKSSTEFKNSLS